MTDEIPERAKLDAKMKSLTGGEPITARPLFRDPVTFAPQHMIFASGNKAPEIDVTDSGMLNRLYPVPFNHVIERPDGERELLDILRDEGAGIGQWLVLGYIAFKRDGLAEPASMKAARDAYARSQNPLEEWFEEHFERNDIDGVYVERAGLHATMQQWWLGQGLPLRGPDAMPKKQLFHQLCDQYFGCDGTSKHGPKHARRAGWGGWRYIENGRVSDSEKQGSVLKFPDK